MSFLSPAPPPGVHPLHAQQLALLGPGHVLPPALPVQQLQQRPAFTQAQLLTEATSRQSLSRQSRVQESNSNLHEADNIKVAVRVRPLLPAERERGAKSVINVAEDHSTIEVVMPGPSGSKVQRDFQFHACLGPSTTQAEVFQLCGVQQLLDAALAGYNVTIFAYGMTGSGKTYTMSGREEVICQDGYQGDTKDGIVTQSVNYLYRQIKERQDANYSLSASYLEIYNEGVYDLLPAPAGLQGSRSTACPPSLTSAESGRQQSQQDSGKAGAGAAVSSSSTVGAGGGEGGGGKQQAGPPAKPGTSAGLAFKPGSMPSAPAKPGTAAPVSRDLSIKWDANLGFHVPGLRTVQCNNIQQMFEVIHSGMQHRHVGSHKLNTESSRSHSLMTIYCHATPSTTDEWGQGGARCGKICFVDLAGSERLKDSKSEGTMLKETTNINKSLFVLGKVISALADRDNLGVGGAHIPYRDSKLTKLLMDSLGGSALALMIACCSPSSAHVEETLSTLSYATRAKNIQNRPSVQYDPEEAQAATYRREIGLLRQENGYLREQLLLGKTGLPPLAHHLPGPDPGSSASSMVGVPPYRFPGRPPLPSPSSSILSGYGPAPWANNNRNWGTGPEGLNSATPFGGSVTFSGAGGVVGPGLGGGLSSAGSSRGGPRGILKAPSPTCPPLRLPEDQGSPARLTPQGATLPIARPGSGAAWHVPPHQDPLLMHSAGHNLRSSSDHLAGHARVGSGGDSRNNHEGESTTSDLRKSCSHGQLQGMGSWSPTNSGRFSGSRPGSRGRTGQPDDLMQRLRETQALLSRFSEEKSLLARENDRVCQGRRTPPEKDHADVLEEITALREQLMGLESAVKAGQTPPAAVKALLGSLRQERGSPCSSPSFSAHSHGPRTVMGARSSRHSSPNGSIAELPLPAHSAAAAAGGGGGGSSVSGGGGAPGGSGGAEALGKSGSHLNSAAAAAVATGGGSIRGGGAFGGSGGAEALGKNGSHLNSAAAAAVATGGGSIRGGGAPDGFGGAEALGKSGSFANGSLTQHHQLPQQPQQTLQLQQALPPQQQQPYALAAAPSTSSSPPGSPQHHRLNLHHLHQQHLQQQQHQQEQLQLVSHPHSQAQAPPLSPWHPPPTLTPTLHPQAPTPPTHAILHPPPYPPQPPLHPSQPHFVRPPHTLPDPMPPCGAATPPPPPATSPALYSAPPHIHAPPTQTLTPPSHPHTPIHSSTPPILPTPQAPFISTAPTVPKMPHSHPTMMPHTPMHPILGAAAAVPPAAVPAAATQQQQPPPYFSAPQQPPLPTPTAPYQPGLPPASPQQIPPTAATQRTPPSTSPQLHPAQQAAAPTQPPRPHNFSQLQHSAQPPPPPPPAAAAPKPGDTVVVADPAKQPPPAAAAPKPGDKVVVADPAKQPPPPPPPAAAAPKPGDKVVVADPAKLALLFS